jgi:hypothetical protein
MDAERRRRSSPWLDGVQERLVAAKEVDLAPLREFEPYISSPLGDTRPHGSSR